MESLNIRQEQRMCLNFFLCCEAVTNYICTQKIVSLIRRNCFLSVLLKMFVNFQYYNGILLPKYNLKLYSRSSKVKSVHSTCKAIFQNCNISLVLEYCEITIEFLDSIYQII